MEFREYGRYFILKMNSFDLSGCTATEIFSIFTKNKVSSTYCYLSLYLQPTLTELDMRVLGLELTSFVVMFLAAFGTVYCLRYNENKGATAWFGFLCCLSIVLAIAGIRIF